MSSKSERLGSSPGTEPSQKSCVISQASATLLQERERNPTKKQGIQRSHSEETAQRERSRFSVLHHIVSSSLHLPPHPSCSILLPPPLCLIQSFSSSPCLSSECLCNFYSYLLVGWRTGASLLMCCCSPVGGGDRENILNISMTRTAAAGRRRRLNWG